MTDRGQLRERDVDAAMLASEADHPGPAGARRTVRRRAQKDEEGNGGGLASIFHPKMFEKMFRKLVEDAIAAVLKQYNITGTKEHPEKDKAKAPHNKNRAGAASATKAASEPPERGRQRSDPKDREGSRSRTRSRSRSRSRAEDDRTNKGEQLQ